MKKGECGEYLTVTSVYYPSIRPTLAERRGTVRLPLYAEMSRVIRVSKSHLYNGFRVGHLFYPGDRCVLNGDICFLSSTATDKRFIARFNSIAPTTIWILDPWIKAVPFFSSIDTSESGKRMPLCG